MVRSPQSGVSSGSNGSLPVDPTLTRILAEIERNGSISFSRYMELALYEPGLGFYAAGRGAGIDFVTSPEISPLFGCFIAARILDLGERLSGASELRIVELGGASGTLAYQVARFLGFEAPTNRGRIPISPSVIAVIRDALGVDRRDDPPRIDYEIVDPASADNGLTRQELVQSRDLPPLASSMAIVKKKSISDRRESVRDVKGCCGFVIANEVFDNIPSDILVRYRDEVFDLRVIAEDGRLSFGELKEIADPKRIDVGQWKSLSETPAEFQKRLSPRLGDTLSAGTLIGIDGCRQKELATSIAASIDAGEILLFDLADNPYGSPVVTYAGHHQGFDPFERPGFHDVMVPVRWEIIRSVFEESGFYVFPSLTQADWLASAGMADVLEALSAATVVTKSDAGADGRGDGISYLQLRSLLVSAKALTDPAALGAHTVFEATKNTRN